MYDYDDEEPFDVVVECPRDGERRIVTVTWGGQEFYCRACGSRMVGKETVGAS